MRWPNLLPLRKTEMDTATHRPVQSISEPDDDTVALMEMLLVKKRAIVKPGWGKRAIWLRGTGCRAEDGF